MCQLTKKKCSINFFAMICIFFILTMIVRISFCRFRRLDWYVYEFWMTLAASSLQWSETFYIIGGEKFGRWKHEKFNVILFRKSFRNNQTWNVFFLEYRKVCFRWLSCMSQRLLVQANATEWEKLNAENRTKKGGKCVFLIRK